MRLLHVEDATSEVSEVTDAATDEQSKAAAEQQRRRRPRFNFEEMGIPLGATLQFTRGDAVVTVADARRVRLGDDVLSLTAATRRVLGNEYDVAPGPYWEYEGRLLGTIYEQTYPELA